MQSSNLILKPSLKAMSNKWRDAQLSDNSSKTMKKKKRELNINPFALMFFVIVVVTVLTYIVPAGEYERTEVDGRTVVDPTSFSFVESSPVGLLEMFNSFHFGMIEGASIILFVMLFGGALGIMQKTGSIDAFIKFVTIRFEKREKILIPLLVLTFSLLGALIGSAEDTLVYIAIIVPLMIALKFDTLTGFAIVMLGTMGTGFISGITNPFNTGVAQSIAELPVYSGITLRVIVFIAFYLLTVFYIFRHAKKIKKDPSLRIMGEYSSEHNEDIDKDYKMSWTHRISLIILALNFILLVYGVIQLGWFISEIAGLFLLSGVIMGIIGRLTPNQMADGFIDGCREMVSGALIIGVAQTILVVIQSGGLLDTFLYASTNVLNHLPSSVNAVGMFFVQLIINFFVPSGSGQAALTMPIMTPLADLLGVTRQTAVLAFQFGDGISNMIIPTSGVLLAGLAIAGIPFTKWVKWIYPYVIMQVILAATFLTIAHFIQYGPF